MNQATERRIRAQRSETLHRLANEAEAAGVRILLDRYGQHYATSRSDPTRVHRVDAERGCDCPGFRFWSRCGHHSLLLSQLGAILDAGSVPCQACHGRGWGAPQPVVGTAAYTVTCRGCGGRGWLPPATTVAGGERRPAAVLAAA